MSLLFATGWSNGTTVTDAGMFDAAGTGGGGAIGATGRNSGNGLRLTGHNSYQRRNLGGSKTTVLAGFAFMGSSINIDNTARICTFWNAGTERAAMTLRSDGVVTLTGTASTFTIPLAVYVYIEVKVVMSTTVGAWVVRVNGVEVLNVTGINTGDASVSQFSFGNQGNGNTSTRDYDDCVLMDSTDATATQGAPFNDFLGDVRIDALRPDGAGDSTQLTPSAGSNYQCVDETPRNDDTDYVSSATVGQKDLYTVGNLASSTGTVKAVLVTLRARKDDAGTRTIKAKVKHGGTEGNGADQGLSTTYSYLPQDVFGLNPSTSAAWTIAEVNAMQAGVEIVA